MLMLCGLQRERTYPMVKSRVEDALCRRVRPIDANVQWHLSVQLSTIQFGFGLKSHKWEANHGIPTGEVGLNRRPTSAGGGVQRLNRLRCPTPAPFFSMFGAIVGHLVPSLSLPYKGAPSADAVCHQPGL
jgi:hypothetical protein